MRLRYLATLFFGLAWASCSKSDANTGINSVDLTPSDIAFDKDLILDTPSFIDAQSLAGATAIQQFLQAPPYGHPSFLTTYVSGGLRASEAIALVAQRYQLNPLVFLTFAEVSQGLIAAASYPSPPAKVEYVFGCGCPGNGAPCDPALGGFDKQIDCLGRTLRESLTQVCGTSAATLGGWIVGQPTITIDGVQVTPASEATATLYQYSPLVAQGAANGNWLFYNVWQLYAETVGYFGASTSSWIGDACCGDGMCSRAKGATCAINAPGGMCTVACSSTQACPQDTTGDRTAVCASLGGTGFCVLGCDKTACRAGYDCVAVTPIGGGNPKQVCLPGQ